MEAAWIGQVAPTDVDLAVVIPILDIPFGRAWVARGLLWLLAGVVLADLLRRGERAVTSLPWRVGGGAVAFGVLRTSGMTGHAPDLGWWGQVAVLVHIAAICLWVGGLALLLLGVLPKRDLATVTEVVPRYSKLALGSVAALVVAGGVLAGLAAQRLALRHRLRPDPDRQARPVRRAARRGPVQQAVGGPPPGHRHLRRPRPARSPWRPCSRSP